MIQITYDRPREKLRLRGVKALTLSELMQVIIGSGTASQPVARLARQVAHLLEKNAGLSYEDFLAIQGLGIAKSSQLVATLELARRLPNLSLAASSRQKVTTRYGPLFKDIQQSSRQIIQYCSLDGSGELIELRTYKSPKPSLNEHYSRIAQHIFANAVTDQAASVVIAIGGNNQPTEPTVFELGLAHAAHQNSEVLQLPITAVFLISRADMVDISYA